MIYLDIYVYVYAYVYVYVYVYAYTEKYINAKFLPSVDIKNKNKKSLKFMEF